MRPLLLLAVLSALSGCSLVRDLVNRGQTAMAAPADPVVPGQLLDGEAARLQDSLAPKLRWLAAHGNNAFPASRLAFRVDSGAPAVLVVDIEDPKRINAHGMEAEDAARSEAERLLALQPWRIEAAQARIDQPLSVRAAFRSRDYLRQNARFVEDTVEVRYVDSAVRWRGAPLPRR